MADNFEFYELRERYNPKSFQAGHNSLSFEGGIDIIRQLLTGEYRTFPISFFHEYGSVIGDVIGTGLPSIYLISDHLKNIFESEGFTGWSTFPIILINKEGSQISGFQGFSISGRCGAIDFSQTHVVEKQLVKNGPRVRFCKGLTIDTSSWDQSDFFLAENYNAILCTKKVQKAFVKRKLNVMSFESNVEWDIPESSLITMGLIQQPTQVGS